MAVAVGSAPEQAANASAITMAMNMANLFIRNLGLSPINEEQVEGGYHTAVH